MEEPLRLKKGSSVWWCLCWALEVKMRVEGMEGNESGLDGWECERVDVCTCITDSLCCTPETNTTL